MNLKKIKINKMKNKNKIYKPWGKIKARRRKANLRKYIIKHLFIASLIKLNWRSYSFSEATALEMVE